MSAHADLIRGRTVFLDNTAGVGGVSLQVGVELCPGAHVYSYTITVSFTGAVIPATLARLRLQDSEIDVPSNGLAVVALAADLPGLKWPSSARLIAPPGCNVSLVLTYGNCA